MLFALLYGHQDQVLAAARACDHLAMGDQYWLECHLATVSEADMFATAYLEIRCLLYTSPSPRDQRGSRMPSSA